MESLANMSRFQLILLGVFAAFVFIGVILFATGGFGGSRTPSVPIVIWGTIESRDFNTWTEVARIDDEVFRITYRRVSPNNFDRELLEALAGGRGPDIILMPSDKIFEHEERIFVIPFSWFPEQDFRQVFPVAGEVFMTRARGGIYGLPILVDPLVMYWNRSLVGGAALASPPSSWDGFYDFSSRVSQVSGGEITQSAVALGEYGNITHSKEIMTTLIYQAGGRVSSGEGRRLSVDIDNNFGYSVTPAISALNFFTEFSDSSRNYYSWNRNLSSSLDRFIEERLAVYFGRASDLEVILNRNPNLDLGVSEIPKSSIDEANFVYGEVRGLAILDASRYKGQSFQVISQLLSPDAMDNLSRSLNIPPARINLLSSPPASPFYVSVFYNSALRSRDWIDPEPARTDNIFRVMVESVSSGNISAREAVRTAGRQLNSLIRGLIRR